jgi:hypothetical protein
MPVGLDTSRPELTVLERVTWWRCHDARRGGLAGADEQQDLTTVRNQHARDGLAVERADGHRWIWPHVVSEALEHLLDATCCSGPDPFDTCEERFTDCVA